MRNVNAKFAVILIAVAIVTVSVPIAAAQSDQVERVEQVLQDGRDGTGEVRDAASNGTGDVAGSTDELADDLTDAGRDVASHPVENITGYDPDDGIPLDDPVGAAWDVIRAVDDWTWWVVRTLDDSAWNVARAVDDYAWNLTRRTFDAAWGAAVAVWNAAWDAGVAAWNSAWNAAVSVFNAGWDAAVAVWSSAWDAAAGAFNAAWGLAGPANCAAWRYAVGPALDTLPAVDYRDESSGCVGSSGASGSSPASASSQDGPVPFEPVIDRAPTCGGDELGFALLFRHPVSRFNDPHTVKGCVGFGQVAARSTDHGTVTIRTSSIAADSTSAYGQVQITIDRGNTHLIATRLGAGASALEYHYVDSREQLGDQPETVTMTLHSIRRSPLHLFDDPSGDRPTFDVEWDAAPPTHSTTRFFVDGDRWNGGTNGLEMGRLHSVPADRNGANPSEFGIRVDYDTVEMDITLRTEIGDSYRKTTAVAAHLEGSGAPIVVDPLADDAEIKLQGGVDEANGYIRVGDVGSSNGKIDLLSLPLGDRVVRFKDLPSIEDLRIATGAACARAWCVSGWLDGDGARVELKDSDVALYDIPAGSFDLEVGSGGTVHLSVADDGTVPGAKIHIEDAFGIGKLHLADVRSVSVDVGSSLLDSTVDVRYQSSGPGRLKLVSGGSDPAVSLDAHGLDRVRFDEGRIEFWWDLDGYSGWSMRGEFPVDGTTFDLVAWGRGVRHVKIRPSSVASLDVTEVAMRSGGNLHMDFTNPNPGGCFGGIPERVESFEVSIRRTFEGPYRAQADLDIDCYKDHDATEELDSPGHWLYEYPYWKDKPDVLYVTTR